MSGEQLYEIHREEMQRIIGVLPIAWAMVDWETRSYWNEMAREQTAREDEAWFAGAEW